MNTACRHSGPDGEGPTHGFAIAGLLAQEGSVGQVWYVPKQVVYRAAQRLEHLSLITVSGKQPSGQPRPDDRK